MKRYCKQWQKLPHVFVSIIDCSTITFPSIFPFKLSEIKDLTFQSTIGWLWDWIDDLLLFLLNSNLVLWVRQSLNAVRKSPSFTDSSNLPIQSSKWSSILYNRVFIETKRVWIVNQFQEFVRGFNAVLYFSIEQEVAGL